MAKEKKELTKRELEERRQKRLTLRNRITAILVIAVLVLVACAPALQK